MLVTIIFSPVLAADWYEASNLSTKHYLCVLSVCVWYRSQSVNNGKRWVPHERFTTSAAPVSLFSLHPSVSSPLCTLSLSTSLSPSLTQSCCFFFYTSPSRLCLIFWPISSLLFYFLCSSNIPPCWSCSLSHLSSLPVTCTFLSICLSIYKGRWTYLVIDFCHFFSPVQLLCSVILAWTPLLHIGSYLLDKGKLIV